jgi:tetratricopeptide (TPR) repeat protein
MIDKIEIEKAKTLLDQNNIGEAIALLEKLVEDPSNENKDVAYYVLGNAYRRGNNWQNAINSYSRAIELNPSSPAKEMRASCIKILDFYNKDMYNP